MYYICNFKHANARETCNWSKSLARAALSLAIYGAHTYVGAGIRGAGGGGGGGGGWRLPLH